MKLVKIKQIIPTIKNPCKNSIITQIYSSKNVKAYVFSVCSKHTDIQEDLYHEVFIALMKINEETLIDIYKGGRMHFKIFKMVEGMLTHPSSSFYSKYIAPKKQKLQASYDRFNGEFSDPLLDVSDCLVAPADYVISEIDEGSLILDQEIQNLESATEFGRFDKITLEQILEEGSQVGVHRKYNKNRTYINNAHKRAVNNLRKSMTEKIKIPEQIILQQEVLSPIPTRKKNKKYPDIQNFELELHKSAPIFMGKKRRKK